jgi:Ca2+-binding RTX toxin-like protein
MPSPRHGLGVVAVGDEVYTLFGGPEPGASYSAVTERMGTRRLDRIRCFGRAASVVGSPVRDVLVLGGERDVVVGLGGSDVVEGGRGPDRLCGRGGNDRLRGGPGADRISGGAGSDRCDAARRRRSCERD